MATTPEPRKRCEYRWGDGQSSDHQCQQLEEDHPYYHRCDCDAHVAMSMAIHNHGTEEGPGLDCPERVTGPGYHRGACLTGGGLAQ